MKIPLRRAVVPGVAALALAASLAACGGSDNADATTGNADSTGGSAASGTLAGGGSSAQENAQKTWRAGFASVDADVTVSYDSVGSGDGRSGFISGSYAFAGSDSPMSSDEMAQAKSSQQCSGQDAVQIPVYISPIDVDFNLPGVDALNLDAATVAKIFTDKITMWNDPAIKALNAGVSLPATKITPVHRSDSSGTTDNFTDFLNKAAPDVWTDEHSGDWPTTSGESGEGNDGVLSAVKAGEGTIGYNDDSVAKNAGVGIAKIKVGSGFNAPSADGAAAALDTSSLVKGTPATVMQYDLNRTSTDPSTYPIFMASYEIACQKYADAKTGAMVKDWLTYITSDGGQKAAQANAFSAPLPASVADAEQNIISKIS